MYCVRIRSVRMRSVEYEPDLRILWACGPSATLGWQAQCMDTLESFRYTTLYNAYLSVSFRCSTLMRMLMLMIPTFWKETPPRGLKLSLG